MLAQKEKLALKLHERKIQEISNFFRDYQKKVKCLKNRDVYFDCLKKELLAVLNKEEKKDLLKSLIDLDKLRELYRVLQDLFGNESTMEESNFQEYTGSFINVQQTQHYSEQCSNGRPAQFYTQEFTDNAATSDLQSHHMDITDLIPQPNICFVNNQFRDTHLEEDLDFESLLNSLNGHQYYEDCNGQLYPRSANAVKNVPKKKEPVDNDTNEICEENNKEELKEKLKEKPKENPKKDNQEYLIIEKSWPDIIANYPDTKAEIKNLVKLHKDIILKGSLFVRLAKKSATDLKEVINYLEKSEAVTSGELRNALSTVSFNNETVTAVLKKDKTPESEDVFKYMKKT